MPKGIRRSKVRLTKRVVEALSTRLARGERFYDLTLAGFGVAVYPGGRKSFFLDYGSKDRRRRMKLGEFGPLTLEQARKKAEVISGRVVDGADPLAEREVRQGIPLFADWVSEYLKIAKGRKRSWRR